VSELAPSSRSSLPYNTVYSRPQASIPTMPSRLTRIYFSFFPGNSLQIDFNIFSSRHTPPEIPPHLSYFHVFLRPFSIHTISLFVLSLKPHYYILYVNQGRKKLIENLDIVPDCLSGAAMPLKSHVLASDLSIFFTSSKQLMFSARKLTANEWSLRWILWTGRQGCFRPCQTYNLLLAYNPSREPPRAQNTRLRRCL
jgi:hypothetical protein